MADFVNPTTLDLVRSANEMPAPWVVCTRANLEAWESIQRQYRKWVTDHVEEMTVGEKAAADAAALAATRDSVAARLDEPEEVLRAIMLLLVDEFNARAATTNALLDAIDAASSLSALKSSVATISNVPTRTIAQLKTAIRAKLGG